MASKKASQLPVASSVADNDSIVLVTGGTPTTKTAPKSVLLNGVASSADLTSGLATKANASDLIAHTSNTSNPHAVTKSQVGLSNVDNIADSVKPVSIAQLSAINERAFKTAITVGPPGSKADYICDGVADNIKIQAAVDSVATVGGGVVSLMAGTYFVSSSIVPKSGVCLLGAGEGITVVRFAADFASGTMIRDANLDSVGLTLSNVGFAHLTLDAQDISNKGLVQLGTVMGATIRHCTFTNMNCPTTAKWTLRIGNINDADIEGSASYGVLVHHATFTNNNCNSFEVTLLSNTRNSWVHHNRYTGNTTILTDEVSIYNYNVNIRYTDNIHTNWSTYAVGAKESDQADISHNTFVNSATSGGPRAVRLYNLINSKCNDNIILMGLGNSGYGIYLQDRNTGLDGHAQRNPNSFNLAICGNEITNAYYGISGTANAGSNFSYHNIAIEGNHFYNCQKSPLRIGPGTTGATMDIHHIHVRNNIVHSWSGNFEGALSFYGDTADVTKLHDVFIVGNYVENNISGATSGGVRVSAATVADVRDNYLVASGSYGPISTTNSGVIVSQFNNAGVGQVNASGATNGQVLVFNASSKKWVPGTAGSGDVVGPAGSTDNAIARFDTTTGKLVQDSTVTISDSGVIQSNGNILQFQDGRGTGTDAHAFYSDNGSGAQAQRMVIRRGSATVLTRIFSSSEFSVDSGGSTGDILKATSAGLAIGNASGANSKLQVAGPIATALTTKTAAYTLTATDSVILADATTAAFTCTLPTAAGISGRQYTIKRINSGSNNVTVATTSSQTVDGSTTKILSAQWSAISVVSDGANWEMVQSMGTIT